MRVLVEANACVSQRAVFRRACADNDRKRWDVLNRKHLSQALHAGLSIPWVVDLALNAEDGEYVRQQASGMFRAGYDELDSELQGSRVHEALLNAAYAAALNQYIVSSGLRK